MTARVFVLVMVVQAGCGLVAVSAGEVIGWLALAAVPGVVATRTWGRRVVGVLLMLASVAATVTADTWVGALAAGGVLVAGAAVVVLGPRWPSLGGRYQRTRPPSAWQTLDTGGDPTLRVDRTRDEDQT